MAAREGGVAEGFARLTVAGRDGGVGEAVGFRERERRFLLEQGIAELEHSLIAERIDLHRLDGQIGDGPLDVSQETVRPFLADFRFLLPSYFSAMSLRVE